jgi:hypothetical protein
MNRRWELRDLEDSDLIRKGIIFGRSMWVNSIRYFDKYVDGTLGSDLPKQPPKITNLGRRLIAYYSTIILE